MRQIIFIAFLFSVLSSTAQVQIPAESKQTIFEIEQKLESELTDFTRLQKTYPIYKINNTWCLSVVAKISSAFSADNLPGEIKVATVIGDITTLKVPLHDLKYLPNLAQVEILEVAKKIKPDINQSVGDMRVDSVMQGLGLPKSFSGKNVIIGITDWGFDYTHPMFYDTLMQQSRILAAWDQFKKSGPAPSGYNYGTLHNGTSQLMAAESDTACVYYDYATHGSHVAGIAGGGGAGIGLVSGAHEANFIFSQLYLDVGSAIDAVNWMKTYAQNQNKRLVVNMSWGLYHLGPLDGTSLLSQAFDAFVDNGVVIITSGGNNGSVDFHIKHNFQSDTIRSQFDFYTYTYANMWGQSITMWGDSSQSFQSGFEVYSGNVKVAESPWFNTTTAPSYSDSIIVLGADTIEYNFTIDATYPTNNRPYIRMRVKNKNGSYKIVLKSYANSGTVHYWNVTETTTDVGNWGMDFRDFGGIGIAGDNEYGIGEPACTEKVITIAAHYPQLQWPDGTIKNGGRASFSSIGPTLDGRMKPDISAPGALINSSISSFTTRAVTPSTTINFNGKTYTFSKFSGTSMSSPNVTSVVALMLEANPGLTPQDVKQILQATARSDDKTGTIPTNGDTKWGKGKITATKAVLEALKTVGIGENFVKSLDFYPTVTSSSLNLNTTDTDIEIFNLNGVLVYSGTCHQHLDVSFLKSGSYIIIGRKDGEILMGKFIKI